MTIAATLEHLAAGLTRPAAHECGQLEPVAARCSSTLVAGFRRLASAAGADHYLVADLSPARGNLPNIVACNWPYDIVMEFGGEALERLVASNLATFPGAASRALRSDMLATVLDPVELHALTATGAGELYAFRLMAGGSRYGAILSARDSGAITATTAQRAQLKFCHLLSDHCADKPESLGDCPLSVREVDCLRWVSQGKTTEEVALILGVSANTINNYITQSINKLAASNRAMATAIALREGLI